MSFLPLPPAKMSKCYQTRHLILPLGNTALQSKTWDLRFKPVLLCCSLYLWLTCEVIRWRICILYMWVVSFFERTHKHRCGCVCPCPPHTDTVSVLLSVRVLFIYFSFCTHACGGVRVNTPVFAPPCVSGCVCLINGGRCRRVGGGMGKTQRSAITLKHAGPYLCHEG